MQHVPICKDSDFLCETFVKMPKHHYWVSSEKTGKENWSLEDLFKENKELLSEVYFECTYLLQDFSIAKFMEVRGGQEMGNAVE